MFAYHLVVFVALVAIGTMIWKSWSEISLVTPQLNKTYDYIIVGAGTAGSVLASRLSEDTHVTVAVLEAGPEETQMPMFDIPLMSFQHQRTSADWEYKTVPQKNACQGLKENRSYWAAGKALGGTTNLNYMLYSRGNRHDFDEWANKGCKGWNYDRVLPYFMKSENNWNGAFARSGYHGTTGPQVVSDIKATSLADAFLQAGREMGYKHTDVNGKQQIGFMHTQATIKRGQRWSTAKAFLRPAMTRDNLHVATGSQVTRILFEDDRAVGVEYVRNGTSHKVYCKKEVILSAGTVGSPHLLMLSGVGHKEHLQKLKIPVVADLPVGDNLQDHLTTDAVSYSLKEPLSITEQKVKSFWVMFDYMLFGTGYLSSPAGFEGVAFINSPSQPKNSPIPNVQLMLNALLLENFAEESKLLERAGLTKKAFRALHGNTKNKDGLMIIPVLLHPKSRGTIRLNQNDSSGPPLIDPHYLEHPDDAKTLIEGVQAAGAFNNTRIFKSVLGAQPLNRAHPSCVSYEEGSGAYWDCYIRHNTLTMNHAVGTCKMGSADDSTAVVDSQLRVRGIHGLRVVDASVMPIIPSGPTAAPTIMIAEKAADLIRGKRTVAKVQIPRDSAATGKNR